MKKLFVCVLFILSISPLLAMVGTNVPIKADDVITGGTSYYDTGVTAEEQKQANDTALLLKYLQNGGTIDYSNSSSGYDGQSLVADFGDFVSDALSGFGTFIKEYVLGIRSEFHMYPLSNPAVDSGITALISALPSLNSDNPVPTPNPNPEYLTYIDMINGDGFYFKYWDNSYGQESYNGGYILVPCAKAFPFYNYSWFGINGILDIYENSTHDAYGVADITDINIFYANDEYNLSVSPTYLNGQFSEYTWVNGNYWDVGFPTYTSTYTEAGNWTPIRVNSVCNNRNTIQQRVINYSVHGTLEQVFDYCSKHFKNVNIYVDGVPWSIVGSTENYNIVISNGTVEPNTNERVRWMYDKEIYTDIEQIIERLDDLINRPNPSPIKWEDFEDLIVDVNGQQAVAVTIFQDEDNVDDWYVKHYGTLIPIFPINVSFPVSVDTVASLITIPTSVIPSDLMEVLEYIFLGTLMVCLLQRLLE